MKRKKIIRIGTATFFAIAIVYTTLHLFTVKTYHSCISITFNQSNIPLALVDIQGEKYALAIDLGDKFSLSLNRHALKNLGKMPHSPLHNRDAWGKSYETQAYILSKIKIGDLSFNDVIVAEVNEAFVKNTTLWAETDNLEELLKDRFGTIGRGLLGELNLLLDVKNSLIFVSNNIKKLKKDGYNLEQLIKVPFETGRTGVVLSINTDIGTIKLSIDTGSTVSLLRSSLFQDEKLNAQKHGLPVYATSKFQIGNKDFGNTNLYLFDMTPELNEIDGVLGMDFLKNHVVYIDYKNKVVYIGDSLSRIEESRKL